MTPEETKQGLERRNQTETTELKECQSVTSVTAHVRNESLTTTLG